MIVRPQNWTELNMPLQRVCEVTHRYLKNTPHSRRIVLCKNIIGTRCAYNVCALAFSFPVVPQRRTVYADQSSIAQTCSYVCDCHGVPVNPTPHHHLLGPEIAKETRTEVCQNSIEFNMFE